MQDYLEWKASTTKNPNTVKIYEMWIRRFLKFLKGKDITLESIGRFKTQQRVIYSPKNVQYGLNIIRDYISYQNAIHDLKFPLKLLKIPQERSNSHPAITREEFDAIMALLPSNEPIPLQRKVMLSLLWDTGMRLGELMRLQISDLKEQGAIINNEKNHRSRRIGWSMKTEKLLQKYLPLRKNLDTPETSLFVSFRWKPAKKMTSRQVERILEELRGKANLKSPIRPHSFRHGFVHRQLQKRTPITTIAQMLGHSSTANVLTYAQLNSMEIQEAWVM